MIILGRCFGLSLSNTRFCDISNNKQFRHNSYPEMAITQPGVIQYTVYVRKGFYYASDIMIIDNDRGVDMKTVLFSKWPLVDVVCCVVFNLLILWPQVPIMFKTVMYPLTTPPY